MEEDFGDYGSGSSGNYRPSVRNEDELSSSYAGALPARLEIRTLKPDVRTAGYNLLGAKGRQSKLDYQANPVKRSSNKLGLGLAVTAGNSLKQTKLAIAGSAANGILGGADKKRDQKSKNKQPLPRSAGAALEPEPSQRIKRKYTKRNTSKPPGYEITTRSYKRTRK